MPPRKRARSSPGSSSSSSAAAPLVELDGGEPLPPKLVSLWRANQLCDTTIKMSADGSSFAAHRVVLASGSTYFEGLFNSERSDANAPALAEVPASVFEPLLHFIYEGRCSCDQSVLTPLLRAANYLGVKPLELSIGTALQARLLPSNAFALWTLAEDSMLPLLEEAAKSLALSKFEEVKESLAEEASWDQVHALVSSDELAARSEEAVFEAVVRYAEAQRPEEERLLALMRHVRFPLMRREFVEGTVYPWPMLDTKAGRTLLCDAFMPAFFAGGCVPRVGFGPRLLYVMGGGSGNTSVEIFNPQTNSWTAGVPLPAACGYAAAAALDGKIYLVGGSGGSSKVEAFDPQAGAWAEVAPMPTGRTHLAAAVVGGRLFAIGGERSDGTILSTVEAFNPQTGAWAAVAPMPTARDGAGAAFLEGKIYVVGGYNEEDDNEDAGACLATVEVYDPATNAWSQAPPMSTARSCVGVAALGGKLYAAGGGNNDEHALSSAEVFDPQTQTWAPIAPMSTERKYVMMTAVQGKLYAAGGDDTNGDTLDSVEAYDPQQKCWEAVASMAREHDVGAMVAI